MNANTFTNATAQLLKTHPLLCSNDKMPRQTTVLSLHAQAELAKAKELTAGIAPLNLRVGSALTYGRKCESLAVIAQREQMAKAHKAKRVEWTEELDEVTA